MNTLLRDIRFGIRMLIANPGFTFTAIAVLALGIGANTAVFSLVNAFLLKPVVMHKPEELAGCFSRDTKKPDTYRAFSYPNYVDLRESNTVFSSLTAHNLAMVGLLEGNQTRRVFADLITSNYFTTLGVPLFRGREFTPAEEQAGSGLPVAIVSYSYWQKTGADQELLGKTLGVNSRTYTIVGITREGFTGTMALLSPELYLPLGMYEQAINDFEGQGGRLAARDHHNLILIGRLRPGVTEKTADPQLALVASRLEKAYPAENKDQTFLVRPLSRLSISTNPMNDSELMIPAVLLLSMAGVVLLIASLNVANMMLARGTARRREIAIRLALGGGRRNILQQLFTEGLVLAISGGVAGLVLAYWSTAALVQSLVRLAPIDVVYTAGPDRRVLAATMGFCLLSTLLFAFGPAWSLSRPDLHSGLKSGELEDLAKGKRRRIFARRNLLVMSQISLSLTLLTAAGLFIRSSLNAARVEPGFSMENGVVIEVDPSLAGYDESRGRPLYRALLERLRTMPGVESASVAATVPFGMMRLGRDIQRPNDSSTIVRSRFNIVSEDYFNTLGIPVIRGRAFVPSDAGKTPLVAVLDELAARRLWPDGDAVGQHIRSQSNDGTRAMENLEVVGIVGNTQERIFGRGLEPHVYVPFGQHYQADMSIHLKVPMAGSEAEARTLETVRREIRAVDDRLPVLVLKTLRGNLESSMEIWVVRTGARVFTIFGAVALLLAMIGLYGVRAYTVARRTREIGIRMALGANASDALQAILREGLMLTFIGSAAGLAFSLGIGKVLAGVLYHVNGTDPLVFFAATALLAGVSLLACYFPARKAARVDPMVALREE